MSFSLHCLFQPNVPGTNDPGVVVSLYYESLCPYCKSWITDELIPSFQKLQQYMTVEFIPYGNAHVSGSWILFSLITTQGNVFYSETYIG